MDKNDKELAVFQVRVTIRGPETVEVPTATKLEQLIKEELEWDIEGPNGESIEISAEATRSDK